VTAPTVQLEATAYTVSTDGPEADGTATWDEVTAVVVRARAEGQEGLGWTYTDRAGADLVNRVLAPAVADVAVLDVAGAAERMSAAARNMGRTGMLAAAISAVDVAWWDLKARILQTSLSGLLGRVRQAAAVYGSGGFTTYDDDRTSRQLSAYVDDGIPRVKIKIGESWGSRLDRDLHRVRLARRVIGPDPELFVDANGGYSVAQAIRVDQIMTDCDVRWFEEPVSSDYPGQLAAVRQSARADIAAGEYGWRLSDFTALLQAGAVDCLQIDVTRCGGITVWQQAAALAAGSGLEVSAHCAPQLSAQVGVATPNFRHLEYFHDHARLESELFEETLRVTGGALCPDAQRLGHGMHLSQRAEQYRVG
jgi:L-alanine-DL-glutamate epimerase-like enolase superfamily enzyme